MWRSNAATVSVLYFRPCSAIPAAERRWAFNYDPNSTHVKLGLFTGLTYRQWVNGSIRISHGGALEGSRYIDHPDEGINIHAYLDLISLGSKPLFIAGQIFQRLHMKGKPGSLTTIRTKANHSIHLNYSQTFQHEKSYEYIKVTYSSIIYRII